MRSLVTILIGLAIICVEVFLGVRTFYPEVLDQDTDAIDAIIANQKSVMETMTPEDLAWAANSNGVTIGVDPNFYPLEMFDERGRYTGIAGDYLRLLSKMTGLNFKPVRATDWAAVEEQARDGKIDMFMAAAKTGRRSEYMLFTAPYITLPGAIMTRKGGGLDKLDIDHMAGKKVAVVKDYSWHDFLKEFHPEIQPVEAVNTAEALQKVVSGEADAVLDYEFNLMESILTGGVLQLQHAGAVRSSYGHAIAVQKNMPELFNIISAALARITPEERKIIAESWLERSKPAGRERHLQWVFFFFVQAILLCISINLYINWQARKKTMATIHSLCPRLEYKDPRAL